MGPRERRHSTYEEKIEKIGSTVFNCRLLDVTKNLLYKLGACNIREFFKCACRCSGMKLV